jgi:hypothetical protein
MESALSPKRSPLILVGDAPAFLREAVGVSASVQRLPTNNSYFLVFADAESILFPETLERLFAAGVPADQVFLAYDACSAEPALLHAFAGKLWVSGDESQEDLRHRLASALMAQRHRKLEGEIERAEREGVPAAIGPGAWLRRIDGVHLAHAFCLALELSPQQHGRALRAAFEAAPASPWSAELSLEQTVAACAHLACEEGSDPHRFREAFRREAGGLPPRLRTELRAAVDRCLEAVWRAHAPVA